MDYLQQCGAKKVTEKRNEILLNIKIYSASEECDAVYFVGLKWHCILQAPSTKSDVESRQILIQTGPIKSSNR